MYESAKWCCEVVGSCEVEQVARCSFLLPCNLITRNSSGDEIANVNFLYDDIVHVLQTVSYTHLTLPTILRV